MSSFSCAGGLIGRGWISRYRASSLADCAERAEGLAAACGQQGCDRREEQDVAPQALVSW